MKNFGMMLLAVYLILVGLKAVIGFGFQYDNMIFGVIGIAAGVLILMKK